jgi:hypothetical protein
MGVDVDVDVDFTVLTYSFLGRKGKLCKGLQKRKGSVGKVDVRRNYSALYIIYK